MRWRGGLPVGLAVIERTYSLDAQDDGGTVLTVREDHSGPLAGLLGPDDAGPEPVVPPVLRRAQGQGGGTSLTSLDLTGSGRSAATAAGETMAAVMSTDTAPAAGAARARCPPPCPAAR